MRQLLINVALRRTDTGYRQLSFAAGSLDEAYSIAAVLVRSPEYGRCYAVGLDWQQRQVFLVRPEDVQPPEQPYQCPLPPPNGGPYRALPAAPEQDGQAWQLPSSLRK